MQSRAQSILKSTTKREKKNPMNTSFPNPLVFFFLNQVTVTNSFLRKTKDRQISQTVGVAHSAQFGAFNNAKSYDLQHNQQIPRI